MDLIDEVDAATLAYALVGVNALVAVINDLNRQDLKQSLRGMHVECQIFVCTSEHGQADH